MAAARIDGAPVHLYQRATSMRFKDPSRNTTCEENKLPDWLAMGVIFFLFAFLPPSGQLYLRQW